MPWQEDLHDPTHVNTSSIHWKRYIRVEQIRGKDARDGQIQSQEGQYFIPLPEPDAMG